MPDFGGFVRRQLPAAGLPPDRYDAIVEELASELEARYAVHVARGASEPEAWAAALDEVPSWTTLAHELVNITVTTGAGASRTRPQPPEVPSASRLGLWLRDVRLSCRVLRTERRFTAMAVTTLAICFAGHAAVLAAVDALLLHPLHAPEPDRIFLMANQYPRVDAARVGTVSAPPDYDDRRRQVPALDDQAMYNFTAATIDSGGIPARLRGIVTTPSLFQLLRVRAAHGRLFTDAETVVGNEAAIVLTDGLWRDLYGGDPAVVGQSVRVTGRPFTIVGVLEPGVTFGGPDVRFYIPLAFTARQRSDDARHNNGWFNIGRLKDGATVAAARAQLAALDAANLNLLPPAVRPLLIDAGFYTSIQPFRDVLVRDVRGPLMVLWGAAALLLVIGVVNVGGLAIARSRWRMNEFRTRLALGARLPDLFRPLLAEALLVTGAAMVVATLLAFLLLQSLGSTILAGRDTPRLGPSAALNVLVAIAVGLLLAAAAVAPLRRMSGTGGLSQDGRWSTGGGAARATRRSLVVVQMACAFVLLAGAGVLWISVRNLLAIDTGMRTDGVMTAGVSLPGHRYSTPDLTRAFVDRSLATIRALPGVTAAGATTVIPLSGGYQSGIIVAEGYLPKPGEPVVSGIRAVVTPGYFEAVGTPLVAGRYFEERDNQPTSRAIIIDERLARRFWPDADAVGRRMYRPDNPRQITTLGPDTRWLTVVGVVRAAKLRGPAAEEVTAGTFYLPHAVTAPTELGLVVRSTWDTSALIRQVRPAMTALDREVALFDIRTLAERTELTLASRTGTMRIASLFASVALFLSSIGLYATLVYLLSQRRREFGVRMAVGGTPRHIVGLVVREGVGLALAGIAVGGAVFFTLRNLLTSQLYGVAPTDARVLLLVAVSLTAVALLASLRPAQVASRADAMRILRAE